MDLKVNLIYVYNLTKVQFFFHNNFPLCHHQMITIKYEILISILLLNHLIN